MQMNADPLFFVGRQRAVRRCLHTHTATVREREKLVKRVSHGWKFKFLKSIIFLESEK